MTPADILSHPANVLSRRQRESFFELGYLFLERVVPDDWLARLRAAADALAAGCAEGRGPSADFEFEDDPGGGPPRLRQVLNATDYHDDFWAYASAPFMTGIAADLVGPDVKFRESAMSYKPPLGAGGFKWHQDLAFYPSSNRALIMTLTLLEEVTPEQGPTRLIPGSHAGELYDHYDARGNWLGVMPDHEVARVPTDRAVEITGPAGSLLLTSCNIVHAAERNLSLRARPIALFGYSAADAFGYTDIPYLSRYRGRIVRGRPATHVHSEALRLRLAPDWPRYRDTRMDNALYRREAGE